MFELNSREAYVAFATELRGVTRKATVNIQLELLKISKTLHRLDERACNGYADMNGNWDEEASKRAERREEKLTAKAEAIAKELDCALYRQCDPRGWPIYLIPSSKLPTTKNPTGAFAEQTREYIRINYPQIGIAVPPF